MWYITLGPEVQQYYDPDQEVLLRIISQLLSSPATCQWITGISVYFSHLLGVWECHVVLGRDWKMLSIF